MKCRPPSLKDFQSLADQFAIPTTDEELACYARQADRLAKSLSRLASLPERLPRSEFSRGLAHRPEPHENPHNAWALKVRIPGAAEGKLQGKRVAIKDSICVAGVPLTYGGAACLNNYVPELDATVVTRLLRAGAEVRGTATCEYFCSSSGSHTSTTGPVENPRFPGHSAGGSSSGCAALVAAGEVDIAIGGDQAGSIRIPAAHCGVYGMKPTWGLVPYTGAVSNEFNGDHLGPITANVRDNARALEVIAGSDGMDTRGLAKPGRHDSLERFLEDGVRGLRIAVVSESFGRPNGTPGVDEAVRAAADKLGSLGAHIEDVSIPLHRDAVIIWSAFVREGVYANLYVGGGFGTNHGGLYWTSLQQRLAAWRDHPGELPYNVRFGVLMGAYLAQEYRGYFYTKAMNMIPQLAAAYDAVLERFDLMLMPTAPRIARAIASVPQSPQDVIDHAFDNVENTAAFNLTHHPAMSFPCGVVAGCPVGAMLIGKYYEESKLYRTAFAYEQA